MTSTRRPAVPLLARRPAPRPLVVLIDPLIPALVRQHLAAHARVRLARTPSELARLLPRADALITLLSTRVDAQFLARAPRLRAVGNYAVGVDNIDLAACARHGVRIVNTPDVLTRATAELALALVLGVARRMTEGQALCRGGGFDGWSPRMLVGLELRGRTAVLVGRGRIGRETARLFRAVGLRVLWITRRDSAAQIRAKLRRAQVLSLHVPLTEGTRGWLSRARLALLPRDAIVINTARGAVIDEGALIRALRAHRIFGAGLDVYAREPAIPAALRRLPNALLLPHLGSATQTARAAMVEAVCAGVVELLRGGRPPNEIRLGRA